MLEMKQVFSGYGKEMILRGVELQACAGQITTLLGKNGCGKSTVMKTAAGFLPTRQGKILIDGTDISALTNRQLARLTAYLPQSKNTPDITAGRFVLHGRFPYLSYPRRYTSKDHQIAKSVMEELEIAHLWDVPLGELSGGMRQKVYLAMVLAKESKVILMDEPTTYLDIGQQLRFAELANDLAARGKTVVLVLHDILLALKISHQLYVMEQGMVVAGGTPDEILQSGILSGIYQIQIGTTKTDQGIAYFYK